MPDAASTRELETAVRQLAPASDCSCGSLAEEVSLLAERGWLRACLPRRWGGEGWGCGPAGTRDAFNALRALGRANLSLARLFEGHMNAVKLIALYGSEDTASNAAKAIEEGALLGVWGADDPAEPLDFDRRGDEVALTGAKRFASGLGLVEQAMVTVATTEGQQLLLVPANEPERCDYSAWSMGGMRATRSGRYQFSGVSIRDDALIGAPGDYLREPHFEGGIWRYCAAHLGAAEALYHAMVEQLTDRKRADDPSQHRRIVASAIAIESARLWLLRAADEVEAAGAEGHKAALSMLAREATEDACRLVMENVERALGMAAHVEGSFVHRTMRDLRLFLCQATPDAKRARAAEALAAMAARAEQL
ncbi:acyl-CoA dehydrogenase family protein [Qipengyuania flava]|uniref:acyl-CoA dehydrogenase family protein n=1 Tax=Qipengyuania flava TaxID=192812 RepID=UPI00273FF113|nr:acyl-CoA dehydrogenase family protein [Qipengyuania flava]